MPLPPLLHRHPLLAFLPIAVVLAFAAYGPSLRGDYAWDDVYLVERNPALVEPGGALKVLVEDVWRCAGAPRSDMYHPIPNLSLVAEAHAFGLSILHFRVVNVLLHVLCAGAALAWMLRAGLSRSTSLAAALVITLHPGATEPVMLVTGRHNTLGALFTVLALLVAPARGRRRPFLRGAAAAALCALAFLCKEAFVVAPLIVLAQAVVLHRPGGGKERLSWPRAAAAPLVAPLLVLAIRHRLGIGSSSMALDEPLADLARHAASVLAHYFSRLVWVGASPTAERYEPLPALPCLAVLGAALAVTALAVARWRARAPGADVALFGWVWCTLALAPFVLAVPVTGMWGNRYGYGALIGLVAGAAGVANGLRAAQGGRWTWPATPAFGAFLLLAGVTTSAIARTWRDEETLFEADVAAHPADSRALYAYAMARASRSCEEALPFLKASAAQEPTFVRAWHSIAGCLLRVGAYREALPAARRAARLQPDDPANFFNLGVALLRLGDLPGARAAAAQAEAVDADHPRTRQMVALLESLRAVPVK